MLTKLRQSLIICTIVTILVFIGANISYTTMESYNFTENYTSQEPYNVLENYTVKEPYNDTVYNGYLFGNNGEYDITYFIDNATSYSYNLTGINVGKYDYTICQQLYCYEYSNITDVDIRTSYIIKYRDVQKSREVTKYRDVQKHRVVNKTRYVNLSLMERILQNQTKDTKT
jgi:hypothetical protein